MMITVRDQYCHGEFCKMRDKCARCQLSNIVSLFPATNDWSKFESFRAVGKKGKIETYYECGDKAKEYSLFVPKEEENNNA